jgi:hypothetical protein
MGCVYLIALPFYNGYTRNLDLATDKAAIAIAGSIWHSDARADAIRLEIRQADQALRAACPSRFAYWYFEAHPAVSQRVSVLQGRPDPCASRR